MKLGVMQPYFFPYLGYFDLINSVDRWIVADSVQYMRHGWVNRNRILRPGGGWQYIGVPLRKHALSTPIRDVLVCDDEDWRTTIRRRLDLYRKHAPFFRPTLEWVESALARREPGLSRLNTALLADACAALGIPFAWEYLSEMNLDLGPIEGPADWALRISQAVGASEYVNPPGGVELYDPAVFARHGIRLRLKPLVDFHYGCGPFAFEPHLSIVDVLMWSDPREVKRYLDSVRAAAL
jgi:hypothetical protein